MGKADDLPSDAQLPKHGLGLRFGEFVNFVAYRGVLYEEGFVD
jgi:hypothetical protein